MDTVRGGGQIDPHEPHRIVRAGFDRELVLRFHSLEAELRVIVIIRVPIDAPDPEKPAGRRFFLAANRCRIERDGIAVFVKGDQ
jgi:hypothetical protein